MEAHRETMPTTPPPERESSSQDNLESKKETSTENDQEHFEKDRAKILNEERAQLAKDYTILRDTLLEMRGQSHGNTKEKKEYDRVRNQYLKQIVELHARGDITQTKTINKEGTLALAEGKRGEKGKATTVFELGIERIIERVSENYIFNTRFDMLIEHRPEGEEALPYLEKLIPEIYENSLASEQQKQTQLSPEVNMPKEKKERREALREAFDDIKTMLDNNNRPNNNQNQRNTRPRTMRAHNIRKPSLLGRVKNIFRKKTS